MKAPTGDLPGKLIWKNGEIRQGGGPAPPGEAASLLIFQRGGRCFGIPLSQVYEVTFPLDPSDIPGKPEIAEGIINLHGEIFTLVKTRCLPGFLPLDPDCLDPPEKIVEERMIFLSPTPVPGGKMKIALRVDRVIGTFPVPTPGDVPPPVVGAREETQASPQSAEILFSEDERLEVQVLNIKEMTDTIIYAFRSHGQQGK